MATVRDIIVEAYSRNNLVPRKREVDADMFTAALKCLNGILQDYSTRGYIVAYKSEVDFDANVNVLVGEGPDAQVYAPKIVSPQNILFQNYTSIDWTPMEYIAYDQFYSNNYSDYIVSWQPVQNNLFKLYFKPRFAAQNRKCKLIYNVEMTLVDDKNPISLPTPYIELLTRALAYKLCIIFPRVEQTKIQYLKNELDELENHLTSQNSSNRIITRESGDNRGSLLTKFNAGSFIW